MLKQFAYAVVLVATAGVSYECGRKATPATLINITTTVQATFASPKPKPSTTTKQVSWVF